VSNGHRSFWSSIPGLVTGIAGLLTAVVGLFGLAVQQGWIGGGSGTTTTTVPGGATTTTQAGAFTVSPTALKFQAADPPEKTVKVSNSGDTAITVRLPTVSGKDPDQFSPTAGTCTGKLVPSASCNLSVTFRPSGALRSYTATLQVSAAGVSRAIEVPIEATTLLGG
jgi:hypothetical protein